MSNKNDDAIIPLENAKPNPRGPETPCAACSARKYGVCGALSPEELTRVLASSSNFTVLAGDSLLDEGEPEKHVLSVLDGCLKIYKLLPDGRRQITSFLFPGDFLGLQRSSTYIFSAEAVTTSTVCRMNRSDLNRLTAETPNLERRLFDFAAKALTDVHEQLLLLGRKTAHERLASFLLMLSVRAGERGQQTNPVNVPMSRDDIGDYLGLTTETVSRTFSRLRKSGLISQDKDRKIHIYDVDRLREVAEGF